MLRLKPTHIGLNSRDIDWHHVRHDNRQAQRARGHSVRVVTKSFPDNPSPPRMNEASLPYRFHSPPTAQSSPIRNLQVPIFSTDQDMRQYWCSIMANAGGLPQLQSVSSGRPTMIDTSPSSRSTFQASRASFESEEDSTQQFEEDDGEESNYISHSYESDTGFEDEPQLSSETYSLYQHTHESGQQEEEDPHQSIHESPKHRLSSFFRRRAHGRNTLEQISVPRLPTENTDLDGPSDSRYREDSTYSALESQYTTAQCSLDEQSDAQQLFAASTRSPYTDLSLLASSSSMEDTSELPGPASLPRPRQINIIQRRESGLPRSPLYISQVAVSSSSPEKRPRSPLDTTNLSEDFDRLSLQPRRAKRYKKRSQSYPYVQSEEDHTSGTPQYDGSSQDVYHSMQSHSPIPHHPATTNNPSRQLSPHTSVLSLRPDSHASSSSLTTPIRHSLSPLAPPFTPSNKPIQPPLPLPTHPFSAVRRVVSFASPSPSNSTSPSPSRSNIQSPSYSFNNLPTGRPRTPQYTVYNDGLPADTQPQTPVGLPRNGIPDSLPGVRYGGAYTAPVGGNRRSLGALRYGGNRIVPETPTRRGSRAVDQENARHGWDIERRWRRQASVGGLGGSEEDGDIGEEGA